MLADPKGMIVTAAACAGGIKNGFGVMRATALTCGVTAFVQVALCVIHKCGRELDPAACCCCGDN